MTSITVYALEFEGEEIYVGMTDCLERRLPEHERRQGPSTKRFEGSFRVVYTKAFPNYKAARSHEKFLKSGAGRKQLAAASRRETSQALPT